MATSVVEEARESGGVEENVSKGAEGWKLGHLMDSFRPTSVALVMRR